MKFWGYRRSNGTIGVRNHVLVFPTVGCASTVAQMISKEVPGTLSVIHPHGCGHPDDEKEHMVRTMAGFCSNPNVAGVLLVGLGCELLTPELLGEELTKTGQRFEIISIQAEGGTTNTVAKGKELAEQLFAEAVTAQRQLVNVSELMIGTECGGSDAMSGLTANPSVGVASDLLIGEGGTVIISEIAEMLGAEHVLDKRAADDEVRNRIWEITSAKEASIKSTGIDIRGTEPGPGNIEGGLTSLEEKSLGAIRKGGTTSVVQVVKFAEKPTHKGLVIMDGPADDIVSDTGMTAAGAQVIVFTTGSGTPLGSPIAPVIKVSTNSMVYDKMKENIDINAGTILNGTESIQSVGEEIFKEIIDVASGKLTKAEILGHGEFAIHLISPRI